MSKTWIAKCVSFKGKHPEGEVTKRVVVKAKYKKDGIELAKEELKLFDADHHDKYKTPYLTEVESEEEAERIYIEYLAVREKLAQMEITENDASIEGEKTEMAAEAELPPVAEAEEEFVAAGEELTATIATVAKYPLVEPYAVRLSIAKNGESFVHSMTLINTKNGASLVGQPDIFNPKPFSNIDNAVVYGLAMAIDAVNKYLVGFIDAKQVEKCADILSGFAQDAEGNFMERYTGDHHLTNASFMAVSKPKEKPAAEKELTSDVKRIMDAVKERVNVEVLDVWEIQENFIELHDEHGTLPAAQIVEHILSMTCASELVAFDACEELVSHYIERTAADEAQEEEPPVKYYAGQQWVHYVKEIMAQFEPPVLDEKEIDLAAQNVGKVFNDWKVALFAEKDNYTADADIFKDEAYLDLETADGALDLLKSYARTQSALCSVLACAYDEFIEQLPNQKVALEINNLVGRLLVDETLGCTYDSEAVKALIYSELTANPVEDSTITNPMLKMQWWRNLSADFAKQQAARLNPSADAVQQALNAKVEEASKLAEAFEKKVCVHGDGVSMEYKPDDEHFTVNTTEKVLPEGVLKTEPEEIAEPEITPDPIPAQEFYGDKLLSGELDAPYQLAIALMLKKHGAENYLTQKEYEETADLLRSTINSVMAEEIPTLEPGKTVEVIVDDAHWDDWQTLAADLMDELAIRNLVHSFAVIEEQTPPAEAPEYEPETTRQDNEPLNDEPAASAGSDAPVNAHVEPALQELSVREMFKRLMRQATRKIGLVGVDWGCTVVKQWTEERSEQRSDAHVEIGIWLRDKNGNKGQPVSFYGVTNANIGNYVNDAMMLAVVNGLEMILFSLGLEVEG